MTDHKRPFGLTGGVACGKSTAAKYLQHLGAYIIDADRLAHEAIEPGQASYEEVVAHFGKAILDTCGRIDRSKLGPVIFADPTERLRLNAIVHPHVLARAYEMAAERQRESPQSVVIIDAPLLYEAGMGTNLRKVIVVWCRREQQLERLLERPGISREEAERRIQSQMPSEEKRRRADYVIDCSGTLEQSRAQVRELYGKLASLVEGRPD